MTIRGAETNPPGGGVSVIVRETFYPGGRRSASAMIAARSDGGPRNEL